MPVMHTAISCTGSTADQAVSTVHVQLGVGEAPILDLWQLCHLVSTCHFNSVIQSLNTVIVLLFCYLPVFYYLPVFCYSAIPLVTGPIVSVLVGIWYWLLLYLTGIHSLNIQLLVWCMYVYSIYAFCLFMLPPRGIVLSQCSYHNAFMHVVLF